MFQIFTLVLIPALGTNSLSFANAKAGSKFGVPCVAVTVLRKSENSSRSFFSSNFNSSFGSVEYVINPTRVASSLRRNAFATPRANDFSRFQVDSSVAAEPSKINAMSADLVHSKMEINSLCVNVMCIFTCLYISNYFTTINSEKSIITVSQKGFRL